MIWARAFAALLTLELIGLAVFHLICGEPRRWHWVERIALGFACGLVALPLWLLVASLAGRPPAFGWVGVEVAALGTMAVLRVRRTPRGTGSAARESLPTPWARWIERLSAAWIALACVAVSCATLLEPIVEWDVIAIWALKAKILLTVPISESGYFRDPALAFSHLDYPLLWPFAIAWIWLAVGSFHLLAPKILAVGVVGAIGGLSFGILRQIGGRTDASIFTATLLSLPMLLAVTSRLLADGPLCLFVLGSFGCCRLWLRSRHPDDLRLAAVFAAGLLLTKNDGLGLFAVLLVALVPSIGGTRQIREALWLVVVPVLLAAPWLSFRSGIPKWHEDYGSRLLDFFSLASFERTTGALRGWITALGEVSDWLIFWPVVLVAILVGGRAVGEPGPRFLAAALLLGFGLYLCVTIVSPWDVAFLAETAHHRLLAHLAPVGVLVLADVSRAAGWLPWSAGDRSFSR